MQGVAFGRSFRINWVSFIADFLLLGMVVGPLAAPFLAASGLLILPGIAEIIYLMGRHVCPQPEMGMMLASPFLMAVCMRCYGTVTGLLLTRLLLGVTGGQGFYWLHQYGWSGAALASVLMMAYPLELAAEVLGWWSFNNYVVTLFGLVTGLAWGLFTMPLLHRSKQLTVNW
ncbi:DUF2085 domain-containing protein [Fischerella thermalis]|uniref:DUF2085 domain-containing protein n=1 Tax=Fischerella thermalis TaxID=372787 RepID=UPI000C7F9020|nr:DUF2085 domain-containing protein [Fischerella thermalis]MBF1989903.1 DUF2085 domain-containing protein [Fischerella thermalis M58_A2018_009]MBF2060323.1 DUF2085 domain-containing protein [Fischerella thermalis M66_A2018_004]MBF2071615.1 DUF2085 domain-containing protein [Fischerella thermalis M48_A2018_028]PLZ87915.1 DUF2085 domain-containing protein [Fischerella thermalis CCMEE 5194]